MLAALCLTPRYDLLASADSYVASRPCLAHTALLPASDSRCGMHPFFNCGATFRHTRKECAQLAPRATMCHAGISTQTTHPISRMLSAYSVMSIYGSYVSYSERINMPCVMYLKVGMASIYI